MVRRAVHCEPSALPSVFHCRRWTLETPQFGSQGRRHPAPLRRADGSQDHQTAAGPRGSPRAPVRSGTNLARGRAAAAPMSRRHDGTQRKRCDHWVVRRTETVPRRSPGRAASSQPALLIPDVPPRPTGAGPRHSVLTTVSTTGGRPRSWRTAPRSCRQTTRRPGPKRHPVAMAQPDHVPGRAPRSRTRRHPGAVMTLDLFCVNADTGSRWQASTAAGAGQTGSLCRGQRRRRVDGWVVR